jgi:hypothetical protein
MNFTTGNVHHRGNQSNNSRGDISFFRGGSLDIREHAVTCIYATVMSVHLSTMANNLPKP